MKQSVCVYHNGNSRIVDLYKSKFSDLTFGGNWAETTNPSKPGCLWEICFADASKEVLLQLAKNNVRVIRHISSYANDQLHRLPECEEYDYEFWLNHVVTKNLCFCDEIISDVCLNTSVTDETAIITTGRTASSHLELAMLKLGEKSFEIEKQIDHRFLSAKSAIFLWREDQWECATSVWILAQKFPIHQKTSCPKLDLDFNVDPITWSWIEQDWANLCQIVFDLTLLFQYVLQKPVCRMTTQQAIDRYKSEHEKISYDKNLIIPNYDSAKSKYQNSSVKDFLDFAYKNVAAHVKQCEK